MDENRFGFRSKRDGLCLNLRYRKGERKNAYSAAFLRLEKAFDKVMRKFIFMSLREVSIDWQDKRFIFNLHKKPSTDVYWHMEEVWILNKE